MPMFKGEVAVPYRASAKLGWCLTFNTQQSKGKARCIQCPWLRMDTTPEACTACLTQFIIWRYLPGTEVLYVLHVLHGLHLGSMWLVMSPMFHGSVWTQPRRHVRHALPSLSAICDPSVSGPSTWDSLPATWNPDADMPPGLCPYGAMGIGYIVPCPWTAGY
jgi:hypothetical protein